MNPPRPRHRSPLKPLLLLAFGFAIFIISTLGFFVVSIVEQAAQGDANMDVQIGITFTALGVAIGLIVWGAIAFRHFWES